MKLFHPSVSTAHAEEEPFANVHAQDARSAYHEEYDQKVKVLAESKMWELECT